MRTAAVAITHGLDPLSLLGLGADDYDVYVAALQEAELMRSQRDTALIKALSESTASRVVHRLAKAFKST